MKSTLIVPLKMAKSPSMTRSILLRKRTSDVFDSGAQWTSIGQYLRTGGAWLHNGVRHHLAS